MVKKADSNIPAKQNLLRRAVNRFHDLSYSSKMFVAAGTLVVGGGLALAGSLAIDDFNVDNNAGEVSRNNVDLGLVAVGFGGVGSGLYASAWAYTERRKENAALPSQISNPPSL